MRLLQAKSEGFEANSSTSAATRFAYDFSKIPCRQKTSPTIQPKLMVNIPGDFYEQEADRVAEQVMHMPDARLQPACACGGECHRCKTKQLSIGAEAAQLKSNQASDVDTPPPVQEVLHSSGEPLDAETRAFFEPRFGHDFSNVRVHTGERAAQSAKALDAKAYTAGSKIVFGAGNYAPGSTEGRRLLAHELTHTVQQGSAELTSNPEHDSVKPARGPSFIQRKVEECPQWRPVNDSRVRNLIEGARRRSGDDRWAWDEVFRQRDSDAHCCDLSYAAAEHYLTLTSQFTSCASAVSRQALGAISRIPFLISPIIPITPREVLNAVSGGDDNCQAVVPLDSGVISWELSAVAEICARDQERTEEGRHEQWERAREREREGRVRTRTLVPEDPRLRIGHTGHTRIYY